MVNSLDLYHESDGIVGTQAGQADITIGHFIVILKRPKMFNESVWTHMWNYRERYAA